MDIKLTPSATPSPMASIKQLRDKGSFFELVVIVLVGILFFIFIVRPKQNQLNTLKAQVLALSDTFNQLEIQEEQLENLVNQLEASSLEIAKLDQSLPLHARTTWVYLLLEELINSTGMSLGGLNVDSGEKNPIAGNRALMADPYASARELKKININLSVTGTFAQFEALLKKIENSGRLMDVKALNISQATGDILDYRLNMETYYYFPN